jgi:hypothetical protein
MVDHHGMHQMSDRDYVISGDTSGASEISSFYYPFLSSAIRIPTVQTWEVSNSTVYRLIR